MNTNSKTIKAIGLALVAVLASSPGVAHAWGMPKMFSLDNTWPFRDKDKPQQGVPVRMVGAWTDTVMTQPGQKPQRGFGGRVTFFDKEGKKPILVDGQLVVYAFNEQGREPTDNKPTRRYVFPADQMPMHMSKSDMGASYSFWLPWDDVGGPKTEVSLICRFEPKGGGVVTGEQTHHLLPGPSAPAVAGANGVKPPAVPEGVPSHPARQTLEDVQASRNAAQQAKLAGYEAMTLGGQPGAVPNPAAQMTAPERHLQATTISLPQSYQLPDTAALNAAMQSAGYQPAPQMVPNTLPPQMQMQAAPIRGYNQVAAPAVNPAVINTQPYVNNQPPIQQQQPMMPAPAPMYPGVQAVAQQPVGATPMMGQVQQQSYQQPVLQPPAVQPPMMMQAPAIRQPQPAMQLQSWQQQPGQAPSAAMSAPAGMMYR